MWSEHITVQHTAPWGTTINDLETESGWIEAGSPCVALLSDLAVIRVTGDEADTFLQGQVTCDVTQITAERPALGAHCNPKGRAQATFIACRQGNDILLILPRDQQAATLAALSKFAMFSKADLTADESLLVLAPLNGADATLRQAAPTAQPNALDHLGDLFLIPASDAAACLEQLNNANLPLVGDNAWQLDQINRGVAHIPAALTEQWIPQEINYDLIGGVNFKKGCYKGQEIVARIHYRGQTKVRAYPLAITGAEAVNIGDKITSDAGQGTILAAAKVSECTLKVLSTLKIDAATSENLTLEQNDSAQIQVLPLPYAIT